MSYEQRAAAFFEAQQIMFDQPLGDEEARDCLAAEFEQVAAEARGQAIEEAAGAVLAAQAAKRSAGMKNPSVLPVSFVVDAIRALAPRPGVQLDAREDLAELTECLLELRALVRGECPSLLNEDSGGDAQLDLRITAAIDRLRAGEEG